MRRWLHRGNLVYRRPRPVVGAKDPERQAKLDALRALLAGLPADETAVFQDEVDINTNPKIGSMWMVQGQQATVEAPGNHEKRYLSGSIHWRTGQVFLTEGKPKQGRNTALFLAHLDEWRGRLRRYTKIHVICDYPCAVRWPSDGGVPSAPDSPFIDPLCPATILGWRCAARHA